VIIMNQKIFALLIPLLLLTSGCLSSEAEVSEEPIYEPQVVQSTYDNHSYQYWNVNPMGQGNISEIPLNGSGDLLFSLDLTGFFHESLLWERGYVNYSVYQENETLFSVQIVQAEENYSAVWENMSGNLTVEIQSTGSDSQTDDKPGDFYIAKARFELKR